MFRKVSVLYFFKVFLVVFQKPFFSFIFKFSGTFQSFFLQLNLTTMQEVQQKTTRILLTPTFLKHFLFTLCFFALFYSEQYGIPLSEPY